MIFPDFFFYIFAVLMVLSGLTVITARNPLYNVLALVVTIFALSSLFVLMQAYFVSVILLLVYAGAVLVFFLFVVMVLNLNTTSDEDVKRTRYGLLGWSAGAAFCASLAFVVKSLLDAQTYSPSNIQGTIEIIGKILFTQYLLPFELTSILLMIAIFGIVSLAKGAFRNEAIK